MKVGISTASLFPAEGTQSAISTIKQLGADTAEVFFSTFHEYRPEFAHGILGDVKGLAINSVHVNSNNYEGNLFNPSLMVRGDGYYWLDQVGRSAQLLGCKNYTFHGFARLSKNAVADYSGLAFYINKTAEILSASGVNLCLENVHWGTYNQPSVFTALKAHCPALLGVFDIKQARRSGYPWQMYVKDMAGSIAYAHLSDINANGKMCLPSEGLYDFTEIIKRLHGEGFNGALIIEVYGGDYKSQSQLATSLNYLKEIVYKLGFRD